MTQHRTQITLVFPTAQGQAIHDALTAVVEPQCERHFKVEPTHTVDGVEHTLVEWPVRDEVVAAMKDLEDDPTFDLRINPRETPYADVEFPPLPDVGETMERGKVYKGTDEKLYMCRQSGPRTEHDPSDVPAVFAQYRTGKDLEWKPNGEILKPKDVRIYNDEKWVVRQQHQALEGRSPADYKAGWWKLKPKAEEGTIPEWDTDIKWEVGDLCTYEGVTYKCTQGHTSHAGAGWQPPKVSMWAVLN